MKKLLLLPAFILFTAFSYSQVSSISLNSTLSVGSLNWPDGDWYMRAILLDNMGNEVGTITDQIMFTLTDEWPSIAVAMGATAPDGYTLVFYRSQSPFNVGDNVETNSFTCPTGDVCDSAMVTNLALSNTVNGGWTSSNVVPVELQSFSVE